MRRATSIALLALLAFVADSSWAGVKDSLHNLSAAGPGIVKSGIADQICEFCHISHSGDKQGPLWGRKRSAVIYIPYSSSTAIAQPGQPTGASILCLSCHDGTIALGEVLNRGVKESIGRGLGRMPPGKGLQGTDLSDDHPISFQYTGELAAQNKELALPDGISKELRLDKNGELQCTTCHDPHDSPYEKLLVVSTFRSELCIECHKVAGWQQTSHSLSDATWNKRPPNPWRDNEYQKVKDNACENCHISHTAQSGARLLKYANEEDNCAACHNGNVATKDLMETFKLASVHPVFDTTLVHDPAEPTVVDSRHVECADCHDPHATRAERDAGDVPAKVRGINLAGAEVDEAIYDYEICLRCHGDSPEQPRSVTPRQHDQTNMRLKIQPDNPSFHPIGARGRSDSVPSLVFPLNEESVISCGSCHNSSSAESAGGSGPEGPHGSAYAPLLVRNYSRIDDTVESASAYALCYGCHSRDSILNNESFPEHSSHVVDIGTTCNTCHDPHGISATQGDEISNSHLINFDTSIVSPNSNSLLQFVDNGDKAGSCDLLCHGKEHSNLDYQN